ncbi:DUF5658 family protein [Methanolobus sp. ZRKC3]|uniref:DUF5658 family protein n=1 Tax=Methanolobus sp. ZRKC3 TaxID=3125786 RepID=UPI003253533D
MLNFIFDVRYFIAFYVVGDILTTVFAIENGLGFEANTMISKSIEHYGFSILVVIKILFLCLFYLEYIYLEKKHHHLLWNILKYSLSIFGILIVVNNMLVILDFASPISILYSWV